MRAATHEAALMARCATASMSTAVAGPSRSSTARHFSLLSKQRSALDHHSAAGLSGRNFDASSPGSRPLGCSCCGKKLVAPPASSQLRHASYSTRSPSGGRALMTSAAEKAPARSSPASAPAAEPSASQSSYQPPDLAITNPINPPKGGPPPGPFRGADIKDSSTAPRQDSIELEDNLPSTSSHSEEVAKDSTGACSTLSPSSPSAPRSQKSAAETSTTTTQKSATASAAAATATAPKRGGGAAFRPKKAALTLTPEAISRLRGLSEAPGGPKLIRIGVRNKGCAGMSYHLEYVTPDQAGKFDEKVQQDGITVLIDSKALFSIIGSEMDWQDDRLSSKFIFNNPNVKEACGCGESFLT